MMMRLKHAKTLITGKPGVGKTTLIQTVVARMPAVAMAGFTTSEIRSAGYRSGFELKGLDGSRRVLAHVDIDSRDRVGKYGVDTAGFDAFLDGLDLLNPRAALIVIDEIGNMELCSHRFRKLVRSVLDGDRRLLATIALRGKGLIQAVRQRPDVHLIEVTRDNRDHLIHRILD